MWPLRRVLPYEGNAKKHPQEQVDKLVAIISRHGFDVPIVVDGGGVVIKGHGRLLAASKLGLTEVPVVVRSDLSLAKVREARIADNRVAEYGWDFDALVADVESAKVDVLDFDASFIGFDASELGKQVSFVAKNPGVREITAEDLGAGEHACPRCGFRFD